MLPPLKLVFRYFISSQKWKGDKQSWYRTNRGSASPIFPSWLSHPQQGKLCFFFLSSYLYSEHTEDISSEQNVLVPIVSEIHEGNSGIGNDVLMGAFQSRATNSIKKQFSKGQETLRETLSFSTWFI